MILKKINKDSDNISMDVGVQCICGEEAIEQSVPYSECITHSGNNCTNNPFENELSEEKTVEHDEFINGQMFDDFIYTINDDTVCIKKYIGSEKEAVIPSMICQKEVTVIGKGAFANCESLESIRLPNGITEIGDYAFLCCKRLNNIEIPESVVYIGKKAFFRCSALNRCNLPMRVKSIGRSAFKCSGLREITIPCSLGEIKEETFAECRELRTVDCSDFLKRIKKRAFYQCTALSEIKDPNTIKSVFKMYGNNSLSCFVIEPFAFEGCCSLRSINVTYIDGIADISAFAFCDSLEEITFNNVRSILNSEDVYYPFKKISITSLNDGGANIGKNAFVNCPLLESVNLYNVSVIEENSFRDCAALKSIEADHGLEYIGKAAFMDCSALISAKIPQVTVIYDDAFNGCRSLKEITVKKNGLKIIGCRAFINCEELSSELHLKLLHGLGENAFHNCRSLKKVRLNRMFDREYVMESVFTGTAVQIY